MVEASLDVAAARSAGAPGAPDPDGAGGPDRPVGDALQTAYEHAVRRFKVARGAFIASGLTYLFVLTSGLPTPRLVVERTGAATSAAPVRTPTTAATPATSGGSSTTNAAASGALTWDDVAAVPLGSTEDQLVARLPICRLLYDKPVGDHVEQGYSCPGAHASSAARFTVVAHTVTQRATSNLRGEREAATMTTERFAQLRKGMSEDEALAVTGPCDLSVDQQVNGGRVANWTCYGANKGFVVVVVEGGVVKELLNSLA